MPLIKILILTATVWMSANASAEFLVVEGFVGQASVSPSSLNSAREADVWNSTAASPGSFNKMTYIAGSVGFQVFPFIFASLRYETMNQTLDSGPAGSGATVQDSFKYAPLILMIEASTPSVSSLVFTGGVGVGRALTYEFHQNYTGTGEDITYSDNPFVFRVRGEVAYMFLPMLGVAFEMIYDKVSSGNLKANSDYTATYNGTAIKKGDGFSGADMSGLRVGLGLRFAF